MNKNLSIVIYMCVCVCVCVCVCIYIYIYTHLTNFVTPFLKFSNTTESKLVFRPKAIVTAPFSITLPDESQMVQKFQQSRFTDGPYYMRTNCFMRILSTIH